MTHFNEPYPDNHGLTFLRKFQENCERYKEEQRRQDREFYAKVASTPREEKPKSKLPAGATAAIAVIVAIASVLVFRFLF